MRSARWPRIFHDRRGTAFQARIGKLPPEAGLDWPQMRNFTPPFTVWQWELIGRRAVFLGYRSASRAKAIKRVLAEQGATVLYRQTDFWQ